VLGIGPIVVQTFPTSAGALSDVGLGRATTVHLHAIVGAVTEELRSYRPEIGEPGNVQLGRQGCCLVQVDCRHACSPSLPETSGSLVLVLITQISTAHMVLQLGGNELLPAINVVGCTREGCVGHDVYGKRGDVFRSHNASNRQCGAKLITALFEFITEQSCREGRVNESGGDDIDSYRCELQCEVLCHSRKRCCQS